MLRKLYFLYFLLFKLRSNQIFPIGPHVSLNLPLTTKCLKKLRKRQKEVEQQEREKSQRDTQYNNRSTVNKDIWRGEPYLVKQTFELDSLYDTDFEKVLVWVSNTKVLYIAKSIFFYKNFFFMNNYFVLYYYSQPYKKS